MRGNCCVGCGEEGCSRQGAPEQRMTVTKAPEFPSCTGKNFFWFCFVFQPELERRVRDGVYIERQDDKYGGRVPSKTRKAKVAILKSILSLTGSQ